ncbi:helix-turn-helix transcriptional regulator [Anoxynatronum sibiricum]|uniref:PAS domain-containing protein n=1 Tax=Anoxynatronum sibiricum TaxID=210623 RepID=A0ABU9VY18_9CLOT
METINRKKLHPILKSMIPLVESIGKTFGKNCEVVLHEIGDSYKTIVAIHNGHVTGRSVESPMVNEGLESVRSKGNHSDHILNYQNKSSNGKTLKSSTMLVRDEQDQVIGCLCINLDISEFMIARKVLEEVTWIESPEDPLAVDPSSSNVNDVLNHLLTETLEISGKPVAYMNKEEKVAIVRKLDEQGAFLIKGAIDSVAKVLCVSRYTIYNYLDEIRVDS